MDDMKRSRRAYYECPALAEKPGILRQIIWSLEDHFPRMQILDGHSRVMPGSMPSCSWWVTMPAQKNSR